MCATLPSMHGPEDQILLEHSLGKINGAIFLALDIILLK